MKTLIKKEIRLLMPAWITAMLLAIVPRIFINLCATPANGDERFMSLPAELIFAFGLMFLGINSFGQELSGNTFSALLSQPIKRPRVWLIKVGTLATAFFLVWLAAIFFGHGQFQFLTLSALVVFSGGLWTTLLLRQVSAAFWITLLAPLAIVEIGNAFQDWVVPGKNANTFITAALALYSIAGFGLANWPSLNQKLKRDFASLPVRVSDDTNWTTLYSTRLFSPYARDKSGNIWLLMGNHMKQETNVDNQWLSLQFDESLTWVEVRTNGDLYYLDRMRFIRTRAMVVEHMGRGSLEPLGGPWKWKTATFGPINGSRNVVAIRDDGTLWKFPLRQPPRFSLGQPVQLGTRSDWVAISQGFSLAPDGSIWAWDQQSKYIWLAPSRRPLCLGNIFE